MSKLYLSENGHVTPMLCEELTTCRRARKILHLPSTKTPGTLYLLARPYPDNGLPLRLAVNGTELPPVRPKPAGVYLWYDVTVDPSLLQPGANTFDFWTDATAMNAWALAIEAGRAEPESFLSDDGGRSWRNEKIGYLNILRGEYVVRLRLTEGEDPTPPAFVWEDPTTPRLERLRQIMPGEALQPGPLLERVRALTSWISSSWEHTNSLRGMQYAPWDAETILTWGRTRSGHNGRVPVAMCVHYAVTFVSCCQAVGIPARCAALTEEINGFNGHFVAEVWFEGYAKWVMVDPNADAILWKDGVPLSLPEIRQAGNDLSGLIEWGPGVEFQRQNPLMVDWIDNVYLPGRCFRRRSIWPRADFLSHPELTPPGHGSTAYCETGFVWEKGDLEEGFGMFSFFADASYFDAPPQMTG